MRKTFRDRMVVRWIVARRGGEVKEVEEVNEKRSGDFGLRGMTRGVRSFGYALRIASGCQ